MAMEAEVRTEQVAGAHDVARRAVAHPHLRQAVHLVRGAHVRAAPRELLRHDRVAPEQQRHEVRRRAAGEQREQADGLPRRLEGEHHRGEQRVRRAGEDRRHPDEAGDARIDAPSPPPIVNSGASVPPDVPLPRYTDHDTNFSTTSASSARPAISPESAPVMLS